ncbi:hypothetical protein CYMTET_44381 [Cymbomonas tetramitiformis]|uniref:Peptidylprolyl isomerase n=1 Tax=Cymbomonas tetramitiformis TaxID=36881 RepID=A0AAE0C0C4_9CHLO|nr:hypothetical protein CYMTET_44381 [Cymbomonas tetramitiformis]
MLQIGETATLLFGFPKSWHPQAELKYSSRSLNSLVEDTPSAVQAISISSTLIMNFPSAIRGSYLFGRSCLGLRQVLTRKYDRLAPTRSYRMHPVVSARLFQGDARLPKLMLRSGWSTHVRNIAGAASSDGTGPGTDRQLQVQHILVPREKEEDLNELLDMIKCGMDMAELAATHSQCPSASRGGMIGWISPGRTDEDFERAAYAARLGEATRVDTRHGCHIIKVLDERILGHLEQMSVQELAEILAAVDEDDEARALRRAGLTQSWVPGLQESPLVIIELARVCRHVLDGEWAIASLPQFKMFPLSTFSEWASTITAELDPAKPTIVLCHHGVRSMQVSEFLISQGFAFKFGFEDQDAIFPIKPILYWWIDLLMMTLMRCM